MKQELKLIALLSEPLQPFHEPRDFGDSQGIELTIAVTEDGMAPRNYSLNSHYSLPKANTGGCRFRVWPTRSDYRQGIESNYAGGYGPSISLGDLPEYKHAMAALERIDKKRQAIYAIRGNPVDAADELGRWLECCGVSQVFMRKDERANQHTWLNEGEWMVKPIGEFVGMVRACLYVAPAKPATIEQTAAIAV